MRSVLLSERRIRGDETQDVPDDPHTAGRAKESSASTFAGVLQRLAAEVDRGERVVTSALSGGTGTRDPMGMIALQAGVYRYVEAIDLVTRLIDRAAGAVKTTLQNQ